MPGIFRHHARACSGARAYFTFFEPRFDLFWGQFHIQSTLGDVEGDRIAVFDGADRPAS